jgi:hypothetical protein
LVKDSDIMIVVIVNLIMIITTIGFTFFFIIRQNRIDRKRFQSTDDDIADEIKLLEKRLRKLKKMQKRENS